MIQENSITYPLLIIIMSKPGWIEEPLYTKIKQLIPLPCVDLLVTHNGRLLLMNRKNTPAKGLWFTPGGRIIKNESIENAVKRVLYEETGLTPNSITQCGAMSHIWPEIQTITVFHRIEVESDHIQLNDEHSDIKWIEEIDPELHPYLIYMIKESNIFQ